MERHILLDKKNLNGFLNNIEAIDRKYQNELNSVTKGDFTIDQLQTQLAEYRIFYDWLRPEIKNTLLKHDKDIYKTVEKYSEKMNASYDDLMEYYCKIKEDKADQSQLDDLANYYLIDTIAPAFRKH